MNAQEWLSTATRNMPEAVRDRVSAETLAHLEDAGVEEGADVQPVLGHPKVLRRELGRLYVPAQRLNVLVADGRSISTYVFPCLSLGVTLLVIRSDDHSAWTQLLGQAALLVSGLWLLSLLLTRRLPLGRRRLWHEASGSVTWYVHLWLYWVSLFLGGFSDDGWLTFCLILWPLAVGSSLWNAWQQDRRLRRTLALLEESRL